MPHPETAAARCRACGASLAGLRTDARCCSAGCCSTGRSRQGSSARRILRALLRARDEGHDEIVVDALTREAQRLLEA